MLVSMSTLQQSVSSMQLEMRSIGKRVEQTHLDLHLWQRMFDSLVFICCLFIVLLF
jgi:hypothetical protein